MKCVLKTLAKIIAFLTVFVAGTFTVYWFNLDMKLVRKVYDALQPHYDNLEKDKQL